MFSQIGKILLQLATEGSSNDCKAWVWAGTLERKDRGKGVISSSVEERGIWGTAPLALQIFGNKNIEESLFSCKKLF